MTRGGKTPNVIFVLISNRRLFKYSPNLSFLLEVLLNQLFDFFNIQYDCHYIHEMQILVTEFIFTILNFILFCSCV